MTNLPKGYELRACTRRKSDGELLAGFSCTRRSAPHEREVETHIRTALHQWLCARSDKDRRLLLLTDEANSELIALGAHQQETFYERKPNEAGRSVWVVAVCTTHQGTRSADGRGWGDIILDAVLNDLVDRVPPEPWVPATIHLDNLASLALFRRRGFDKTATLQGDYLIVWQSQQNDRLLG